MEIYTAILLVLGFFVLRLGLPLLMIILIGWLLAHQPQWQLPA